MAEKPLVKCKFCGNIGRTKTLWRGSKRLERFLYITLLFPGPFYTFWRWKGRKEVCAYCESENVELIPEAELPEALKKAVEEEDFGYEQHRF